MNGTCEMGDTVEDEIVGSLVFKWRCLREQSAGCGGRGEVYQLLLQSSFDDVREAVR